MSKLEPLPANAAQTNIIGEGLTSIQLSFSTADDEQSVFFAPESAPRSQNTEVMGPAMLLVVHGDMFVLEPEGSPQPAVPLTEDAGLFRIIGKAKQI